MCRRSVCLSGQAGGKGPSVSSVLVPCQVGRPGEGSGAQCRVNQSGTSDKGCSFLVFRFIFCLPGGFENKNKTQRNRRATSLPASRHKLFLHKPKSQTPNPFTHDVTPKWERPRPRRADTRETACPLHRARPTVPVCLSASPPLVWGLSLGHQPGTRQRRRARQEDPRQVAGAGGTGQLGLVSWERAARAGRTRQPALTPAPPRWPRWQRVPGAVGAWRGLCVLRAGLSLIPGPGAACRGASARSGAREAENPTGRTPSPLSVPLSPRNQK